MRLSILWRTLFAAIFVLSAGAASADLAVHFPFDESGDSIVNFGTAGDANDAPLSSGTGRTVGKVGSGALSFTRSGGQSIEAGPSPIDGAALRTVSLWLNMPETTTGNHTFMSLGLNSNFGGAEDPGWKFDFDIDGNNGGIEIGLGSGRMTIAAQEPKINDGTWRFATVVVPDNAAGGVMADIDVYVDGEFAYDGSLNNQALRTISTVGGDRGGLVYIGRAANGAGSQVPNGDLDDLAIWDEALSADEIKGLYDVGDQLGVNASVFDQVATLHDAGSGTLLAGDYRWTFSSGLSGAAGVTGAELVLNDAANTGVTFSALLAGDVDGDDSVDQDDFAIIAGNLNTSATSRTDGDLNDDGFVNFADFRLWKDASGGNSLTVPEPGSLALLAGLAMGGVALGGRRRVAVGVLAVAAVAGSVETASAQGTRYWIGGSGGNYATSANWRVSPSDTIFFIPAAFENEVGVIGAANTTAFSFDPDAPIDGSVVINTAIDDVTGGSPSFVDDSPGAITLGLGTTSTGTMVIQNGGSLVVVPTADATTGNGSFQVGNGGRGFLTIDSGGALTAESFVVQGQQGILPESEWSKVTLSGTASLSTATGGMNFFRLMEVTGAGVTVSSAADIGFGESSRYTLNLDSAATPVFSAVGNVNYNGNLILNLSGSAPAPTEGAVYDLADSATVGGNFDNVILPGPAVPGRVLQVTSRAGGVNGLISGVEVASRLVLEVDRDSGMVSMTQPFGSAVEVDGYSLESGSGNFSTAGWTSLQSQAVSDWTEANGAPTAISELKPTGSTSVAGAGFDLGAIYAPSRGSFGTPIDEDVVFEYVDPATGEISLGEVIYSGYTRNDLVLIVDPTTGEAQLRNTSADAVSIDGYQIGSDAGSLDAAGWDSLADQSVSSWIEAEADSFGLSELLGIGVEEIAGDSGFNLGSLFTLGGDQDLTLEYLMEGADAASDGFVFYGELPDLNEGSIWDFEPDGDVDITDFGFFADAFINGSPLPGTNGYGDGEPDGDVDITDFGNFADAFIASQQSSSVAIPEPSAGLLSLFATLVGSLIGRRSPAMVSPGRSTFRKIRPLAPTVTSMKAFQTVVALAFVVFAASAPAQTILFNHDFTNAPVSGGPVTSVADLGTPGIGSYSFSGPAIGGIGGGANPALAVGHSGGTPPLTQMAVNSVTYTGVLPETMFADAGTGDRVLVDFASPGSFTGSASTDISFNWASYGTSNTGSFKHQFVRGLDPVGQEIFELLLVSGSGAATRQIYARGTDDDSTTLTAANAGAPEGVLLANNFSNALNGTNVAAGRPGSMYNIDISLADGMVTFDIGAEAGTFDLTADNGVARAINSSATTISQLEFGSIWNSAVDAQNKGYWVDNLFALEDAGVTFLEGDVDGNNVVDLDDFDIIAANFKSSVASRGEGDLNVDGFVDFADFRIWKNASAPSSATIPEPTTLLLTAISLAGLASGRRRGR